MKFTLIQYTWLHNYKLSTQNILPAQKRALSVKTQTRMPLVLKEKKLQLKSSAFNRLATKRVCIETDMQ